MPRLYAAVLLSIAIVSAFVPRPSTIQMIVFKCLVICFTTLPLAFFVTRFRPFLVEDSWKGWVKVMLLLLSAGCAILNASASAVDIRFVIMNLLLKCSCYYEWFSCSV